MAETIQTASLALKRLALQIQSRRVPNKQLAAKLEGEVLRQFDTQGQEFNTPWAPLKTSTILRRLKAGRGSKAKKSKAAELFKQGKSSSEVYKASGAGLIKILQNTGHLRASFAGFSDDDEAGVGARSNADHGDLAQIHQDGDPSRNLPARNMLPPPDMALAWAMEIYQNYIDAARRSVEL